MLFDDVATLIDLEYVSELRSDEDEHFDEVAKVLAGDHSRVRQITIEPGTLNLFQGHYSMHRVTEVIGKRRRLQTIFAFVDTPDSHGNLKHSSLWSASRGAGARIDFSQIDRLASQR